MNPTVHALFRRALPVAGGVVTALTIAVAVLPDARADLELRRGMPVEIELELDDEGRLVADDVELLDRPRSPKLRGPVSRFDAATGELVVLGWTMEVDARTFYQPGHGAENLTEGTVVEIHGVATGGESWRAEEIEIEGVKSSWKVKGTLTRILGDPEQPDAVEVDGLRVEFTPGTDLVTLVDRIAKDLFRDLKEEDEIASAGPGERWTPGGIGISGSMRHHLRREREFDLRDGSARDVSEPSLRLEMLAEPLSGWKVFSQLRWIGRYALRDRGSVGTGFEDEQEFEVRQLYASGRDLGGRPFGVVVGKQRVKDEREFLFDDYLDAVRLYAYGLRPLVLEATWIAPVAPLNEKFEDWQDWLLQARLYPGESWQGRVYALLRADSSERGRDVRYFGLSAHGDPGPVKTWLELSLLRGHDKGLRQEAWAIDVGLAMRAWSWPGRPGAWVGWAQGSGDDDPDDGVSRTFRQTGYEDNSDRIWGLASLRSYGELLDPELANLRTWTAGIGVRPTPFLSLDLAVHGYWLDRLDDEFDESDLRLGNKPLDGIHQDIGHEVDLVIGWRDLLENLHLVGRVGRFAPGPAFLVPREAAWMQMLELRWDF